MAVLGDGLENGALAGMTGAQPFDTFRDGEYRTCEHSSRPNHRGLRFRRWGRDSGRPENGLGAGCLWYDRNYGSHGTKYDWGIRDRRDRAEVCGPADRSVR